MELGVLPVALQDPFCEVAVQVWPDATMLPMQLDGQFGTPPQVTLFERNVPQMAKVSTAGPGGPWGPAGPCGPAGP